MASKTSERNGDRPNKTSGMESRAEAVKNTRQRSLRLDRDTTSLSQIASCSLKLQDSTAATDPKKGATSEELVKYMYDLPYYLQRAEMRDNVQGKALNVGVLDWGRLEKWKSEQKSGPLRNASGSSATSSRASPRGGGGYSASGSQASTSSTTESGRSKDDASRSSTLNRKSSSLKDHLKLPPKEGSHPGADRKSFPPKRELQPSSRDRLCIKLERDARENLSPKCAPKGREKPVKVRTMANSEDPPTEKGKNRLVEPQLREAPLEEWTHPPLDDNFLEGVYTCSFITDPASVEESLRCLNSDQCRILEKKRHSFTDEFDFEGATIPSDVPYSCPLPCEFQSSKWPDIDLSTPVGVRVTKMLSNERCPFPSSDERLITRPEVKNEEHEEPSAKLDRHSEQAVLRWRFNSSSESFRSADLSSVRPLNSIFSGVKSGPLNSTFSGMKSGPLNSTFSSMKSGPLNSTFSGMKSGPAPDDSSRTKANSAGRSRQSPLRRILDQVLKPKSLSRRDEPPPSCSESTSSQEPPLQDTHFAKDGSRKSFSTRSDSLNEPLNRNLGISSKVQDGKNTTASTNALVQFSDRSGFPLLTFTLDRETEVLAARLCKVPTSAKHDLYEWIYTFHSVREVKKKPVGWINQGKRSKKYVTNIVGRMKISSSHRPKLIEEESRPLVRLEEFVLFGAELREAAHEALDFLPNNELAAIVVGNERSDGAFSDVKNTQYEPNVRCQYPSSIAVVVPKDVHSLPASQGVPAPLLDRWRSGGSCDCGGWDVGCMLTILANKGCEKLSLPQACFTPEDTRLVDLYVQGGPQESRHAFSMAAFKEGLYSAEFSASISPLQAFSICVAMLHVQKPVNLPEACNLLDSKTSVDTMLEESAEKESTQVLEAHGRYVTHPPHSPVGRV